MIGCMLNLYVYGHHSDCGVEDRKMSLLTGETDRD